MPYICYVERNFKPESEVIIQRANAIIAEYAKKGFSLTLRQLFYQFVARDFIPNTPASYKNLGQIINDARLAGRIDWNAIYDRTRNLVKPASWERPSDVLHSAWAGFQLDGWVGQKYRPEVWIEKDALVGVIEGVCEELRIPYFSCRGYTSQSEMWRHGERYRDIVLADQVPVLIHLGDHDPSGIDMSRDIQDRMGLFINRREKAWPIIRIALNMDQVQQYEPPPNPAKITDSRAAGYIEEFGEESWELDALEPEVLAELIRSEVLDYRDQDAYDEQMQKEEDYKDRLLQIYNEERAREKWEED